MARPFEFDRARLALADLFIARLDSSDWSAEALMGWKLPSYLSKL